MSNSKSVKVGSSYQITLPDYVRQELNIQAGDHLLVDIQDGMLILTPQPDDLVIHMAGLHQEIWQGVDTTKYLNEERAAWLESNEN